MNEDTLGRRLPRATTLVEDIEAVLHKHGVSYKVGGLILEGIQKIVESKGYLKSREEVLTPQVQQKTPVFQDLRVTGPYGESLISSQITCVVCHETKGPTAFAGDSTVCRKCRKAEPKDHPKDRIIIGVSKDEADEIAKGNIPAFLKTNVLARLKREGIPTAYLVFRNKTVAKWSREELES